MQLHPGHHGHRLPESDRLLMISAYATPYVHPSSDFFDGIEIAAQIIYITGLVASKRTVKQNASG